MATTPFAFNNVRLPAGTSYVPGTTGAVLPAGRSIDVSFDMAGTSSADTFSITAQFSADGGVTWEDVGGEDFPGGSIPNRGGVGTTTLRGFSTGRWPGGRGRFVWTGTATVRISVTGQVVSV